MPERWLDLCKAALLAAYGKHVQTKSPIEALDLHTLTKGKGVQG
jgi:hypothetical protein